MHWFRLLHLTILVSLGAVTFVSVLSIFTLLRPNVYQKQAESHLAALLSSSVSLPTADYSIMPQEKVVLVFGQKQFSTQSASLLRPITADEALFLPSFRPTGLQSPSLFKLSPPHRIEFTWDETRARAWIASISATIDTGSVAPFVSYSPKTKDGFTIFPGKAGVGMDEDGAVKQLLQSSVLSTQITATQKSVDAPLDQEAINKAQARASRLLASKLEFTAKDKTISISPSTLARFISLPSGFSTDQIMNFLQEWSKNFNIERVEPTLSFEGNKISNFTAPVEGRELDVEKSAQIILNSLAALEETGDLTKKELVVNTTSPKLSLDSLNNLGITDRVGHGESDYAHSIPNRIFNVALATSRLHGIIIPPGETFSFTKAIGDISAATGYKQAYVISQGQTILGDGGGVCQVSSTLFRAVLNAGLPILERKGHSYRVGYYEQNSRPGFDATVSAPHPDLVFLNDTNTSILINAQADSKRTHLYIELYGKSDGRKAEVLDYKQWGQTSAPEALYQDDPTLPRGVVKQIDYAAGGLKTSFRYQVTYPDGNVKNTTYLTTYVPWRAVFLRGTRD